MSSLTAQFNIPHLPPPSLPPFFFIYHPTLSLTHFPYEFDSIIISFPWFFRICYPIGAILGGAAAIANQYLRENADDHKFDPLKDTAQDDDLY